MASKNKEYEVLKMSTPYTKPLASDPVLNVLVLLELAAYSCSILELSKTRRQANRLVRSALK